MKKRVIRTIPFVNILIQISSNGTKLRERNLVKKQGRDLIKKLKEIPGIIVVYRPKIEEIGSSLYYTIKARCLLERAKTIEKAIQKELRG